MRATRHPGSSTRSTPTRSRAKTEPRAEKLDQDLKVTSNPDSLAHILQDNLHNAYLGSDAGRAFSQLTTPDSLW